MRGLSLVAFNLWPPTALMKLRAQGHDVNDVRRCQNLHLQRQSAVDPLPPVAEARLRCRQLETALNQHLLGLLLSSPLHHSMQKPELSSTMPPELPRRWLHVSNACTLSISKMRRAVGSAYQNVRLGVVQQVLLMAWL